MTKKQQLALYYGGKGKDGKILVYDADGQYKTKWPAQRIIEEGLAPLTDIRPDAVVIDHDSLNELVLATGKQCGMKPGLPVLFNRKGRKMPAMVIAVTDKAIQLATYYRRTNTGIKNCQYYELSRNKAVELLEPVCRDHELIPHDPPTDMDNWELDFHDDPREVSGPEGHTGYAFSGDLLYQGKKVGTYKHGGGPDDTEEVAFKEGKYHKQFRKAVKEWYNNVASHKTYRGIEDATAWWVAFQMEQLNNLAITAGEFFAEPV